MEIQNTIQNSCMYCLSELEKLGSCTTSCLNSSGISPAYPTTIIFGSIILAISFFIVSLYFKKDFKKLIGTRIISITFFSIAIFVIGMVFNGHYILKELPIIIPAIGVLSYIISYLFSFYIIKFSYNAIELNKEHTIKKLSRKVGINPPRLYIIFDKVPKAFSIYGIKKAIFISDVLLEKLNKKDLESVIMHELYHLKIKTGLFKNILKAISNINFRIIPSPIAELENHDEHEIDQIMIKKHNINMNKIRRILWD